MTKIVTKLLYNQAVKSKRRINMKNIIEKLFCKRNKKTVRCITVLGQDRDIGKNLLSLNQNKRKQSILSECLSKINGLNTLERVSFSNRVSNVMNSRREYAQFQSFYLQRGEFSDYSAN